MDETAENYNPFVLHQLKEKSFGTKCSYEKYYSYAKNDCFFPNGYTKMYSYLASTDTSKSLSTVCTSFIKERPAFLVCVEGYDNIPYIVPCHGLDKFQPSLSSASEWEGQVFAFQGDIVLNMPPCTISFPHSWIRQTDCLVPNISSFEKAINEVSPADATVNIASSLYKEKVATACFIPHCLLPQLLSKRLTPIEAWRILRVTAEKLKISKHCDPLWTWLRVVGQNPCSIRLESLPLVDADVSLMKKRRSVLTRTFPTLYNASHESDTDSQEEEINTSKPKTREYAQDQLDIDEENSASPRVGLFRSLSGLTQESFPCEFDHVVCSAEVFTPRRRCVPKSILKKRGWSSGSSTATSETWSLSS